ncbi:flagellar biosynthesis anti-sigma factor FlgM [Caballeronia grimmiae]|uniref:flagellar biosynthesis anti-sigma factor FlgM n=1 Tax=Caballeronia grimmiae TaxID=1071679 RepID=UPI0038B9FC44
MAYADTRLLVVDDMATMRSLIRKMLRAVGYTTIDEAEDGLTALEKRAMATASQQTPGRAHGKGFNAGTVKRHMPATNDTMKIQITITADTSREFSVRRSTNASADYAAGTAQKTEAVAADTSAVTLSSTSVLRPSSAVDIDIDKVAAIKAALRDGSYSIDSGSIADGMLGTARELLQRVPRV